MKIMQILILNNFFISKIFLFKNKIFEAQRIFFPFLINSWFVYITIYTECTFKINI